MVLLYMRSLMRAANNRYHPITLSCLSTTSAIRSLSQTALCSPATWCSVIAYTLDIRNVRRMFSATLLMRRHAFSMYFVADASHILTHVNAQPLPFPPSFRIQLPPSPLPNSLQAYNSLYHVPKPSPTPPSVVPHPYRTSPHPSRATPHYLRASCVQPLGSRVYVGGQRGFGGGASGGGRTAGI